MQLLHATVTLFGTQSEQRQGTPQYIVNFVLCNVIVTEQADFPAFEQRIITLLQFMDPSPQDIEIVRSSDVVPHCNSSIPVPAPLREMPAFKELPESGPCKTL